MTNSRRGRPTEHGTIEQFAFPNSRLKRLLTLHGRARPDSYFKNTKYGLRISVDAPLDTHRQCLQRSHTLADFAAAMIWEHLHAKELWLVPRSKLDEEEPTYMPVSWWGREDSVLGLQQTAVRDALLKQNVDPLREGCVLRVRPPDETLIWTLVYLSLAEREKLTWNWYGFTEQGDRFVYCHEFDVHFTSRSDERRAAVERLARSKGLRVSPSGGMCS